MSFKACIVVPIYNHKAQIGDVLARLAQYGLTIFVIDDGSDQPTQDVLAELARTQPLMRLYRLSQNSGKGAAVMRGIAEARAAGFTHALQIDADGQHELSDVPRFLERGLAAPQAIICGKPVYDATVPRARLYGRYISHFFVWLETLSFAIADSMCGFRLYPIAATAAVMDKHALPTRMDFDTEVLVRSYWRGTPIEALPTRVTYPQNGLSHFDMLHDNLRIVAMHTRLTLAMLPRLPMLLARKVGGGAQAPSTHWSRLSERGGAWGMRCVLWCYRLLGERGTQLLLYPVLIYFLLSAPRARRASIAYLQRVQRCGGLSANSIGWRNVFLHLRSFAQCTLDKLAAWMGDFDAARIDFPQRADFEALQRSSRGALLIGAHLGNLEVLRAVAATRGLAAVNAVVYTDHAQRFNEILRSVNSDFNINLIQVSELGPATAILLKEKIDAGELLVIVGDRTPPAQNGRVSRVPFLGEPASFPQGPYILAALLDCPVYLFFGLREGRRYRVYFESFAQRIELPRHTRAQQLDECARQYAERLQVHCLRAPYQWFNFYNFWREDASTAK